MDSSPRTFHVAGVKFRPDYKDVVHEFELKKPLFPYDKVRLIGEPGNPFDKYAVKVLINGVHIGYVPKPVNIDIWALRDQWFKPTAMMIGYNPGGPTHFLFEIQITFSKSDVHPHRTTH
jgi:hypothetical protein